MECPSCSSRWDMDNHLPRTSVCGAGHIICHSCCLQRLDNSLFTCICSNAYKIEGVRELNETDLQYKTRCIKVLPPNDQFILMMVDTGTSSQKPNKVEELRPGFMCEDHREPIHSYAEKPFTFVCNRCKYEEYKEINLTYREIPQVVSHLRNQLNEGLKALNNKTRIYREMRDEAKPRQYWANMMNQLDNHYASLYQLFASLHQDAITKLALKSSKLDELAVHYRKEIHQKLNDIRIKKAQVREMQGLPDGELASQNERASLYEIDATEDLSKLAPHMSVLSYQLNYISPQLQDLVSSSIHVDVRSLHSERSLPI